MKTIFVVQKHHSSTLHYDFRLQIGDILKSWVLPKGPSLNPNEKRLAILTNDHELSFADFEGEIPLGQYGAGEIIVWDRGYYENLSVEDNTSLSLQEAFTNGKITFFLYGEKLRGEYTLILMKHQKEPKNWLLIKHNDQYANTTTDILNNLLCSVISDKCID